jgi:hypothetical protein
MVGNQGAARWTDTLLDELRQVGDPLADEPVAAVFARAGIDEVNELLRTLVRVDQPLPAHLPDELVEYLNASLALPDWADPARIERGQRVFEKWGVQICMCLFYASLPSSYAGAKGVQVLHLTARLDTDTHRRILETGQFLIDVLSIGGLDEHGKGRRVIQRVRLMHAAVRHLIKARSAIRPELWHHSWGEPINQEDLAGTMLAFSGVVFEPLHRIGVRLSAADVDAYLHLWNVIAHQLGVSERLMVRNASDATALIDAIERRQFRPSTAGQHLTHELLKLLDELTPGRRFDDMNPALMRHMLRDRVADMLRVPPSRLARELNWLARVARWTRWTPPLGRDLIATALTVQRGGERAPFDLPDRLALEWGVEPGAQPG